MGDTAPLGAVERFGWAVVVSVAIGGRGGGGVEEKLEKNLNLKNKLVEKKRILKKNLNFIHFVRSERKFAQLNIL